MANGKYYIGAHCTDNINDSYMGSGRNLKMAYRKYGIENFKKEVLFVFDNEDDMWNKEAELVTEEVAKDQQSYNLKRGGKGGVAYGEYNPMWNIGTDHPWYGRKHTEDSKRKMSEGTKKRLDRDGHPMTGKKHTDEAKEKNRQAHLGKKKSEDSIRKTAEKNRGQKRSEETKRKMSESAKKHIKTEEHKRNISKSKTMNRDCICPFCNESYNKLSRKWKHIVNCDSFIQREKLI